MPAEIGEKALSPRELPARAVCHNVLDLPAVAVDAHRSNRLCSPSQARIRHSNMLRKGDDSFGDACLCKADLGVLRNRDDLGVEIGINSRPPCRSRWSKLRML